MMAVRNSTGPSRRPATLTTDQEQALRDAGSYSAEMPDFLDRPSPTTAMKAIAVVKDSLSTAKVAAALDLTEGRIRQRATNRTLFTVRMRGELRFPRFQFLDDGTELAGWDVVAPAFPADAHPVEVAGFLSRPQDDLLLSNVPVSPYEWLAGGGDADTVRDLVETAFTIR